jgi:xanthine dehydrogenase small subunit
MSAPAPSTTVSLTVNGRPVDLPAEGSLLDALRGPLGLHSVKDGCSPQGQCGCCTVLVDGSPRVSCVTPVRRVAGRSITTLEGLPEVDRAAWAEAFTATGGSQCGFCTPGIMLRLQGLVGAAATAAPARAAVDRALAAHLCRCTGWQTIEEACALRTAGAPVAAAASAGSPTGRDLEAAARRAAIEGRSPQRVGPAVALGEGGFADDTVPADALVAVPDGAGGWAVGESLAQARAAAGKVQGRRTTVEAAPPLEAPEGDWRATLRTSWVEPAYLETEASWCRPGGEPASPLANGGAFGGKRSSTVTAAARRLADEHGRPVRVVLSREDTVRRGPKRPPVAAGVRADGTGVLRVVRTPGIVEAVHAVAPGFTVEEVDVPGPPTALDPRAAGWAEAAVLLAAHRALDEGVVPAPVAAADPPGARRHGRPVTVVSPEGARATVVVQPDGCLSVDVACGDPLDDVVLRSYVVGAAHQALGWVTSEGLAVDAAGTVHDLTIRSFGILRASDMPSVEVRVAPASSGPPVNGSDAVFAAVAAAVWLDQGLPPVWPTRRAWARD